MKIIIFDGTFSSTAFIRRLMQGLVKSGLQISVIGFNEANPSPVVGVNYVSLGSNQSKIGLLRTSLTLALKEGKPASWIKVLSNILSGDRISLQKQNLDLVLKKLQPDIIHLQWPSLLPWMQPYFQNRDFKIVLSQRGFHTNVRPFIDPVNFKYLHETYPQLDGLHSVSKAISKVGRKIGTPLHGLDRVVYTGLDLEKMGFKTKVNMKSCLQLISVGRPHWKKDYPTAIKACASLKQEDLDFHYTIVGGEGDEESLFLIHELGLSEHITLTGKLPQTEVFQKIQEADVMLLPSIEEGIANVAVEAMALGTLVISTNCGGMEELIANEKEGWIVPTRDFKAMAKAILNFTYLNSDEIHTLSWAARKKVEQQHTEVKMVNDMLGLYQKVLNV
ncbi:glycosyltransferase family 4 protein [Mesonia ostreae]|uniref:Glycosyltransferase family 4 protein n=1 Tax=Mesonia ostreae TaxID=861110 RepID=A0ABU2KM66_9FLAO|nr:glycosyltransferase family 4 protein [Mesonia ostreae]MDT0295769.1 glycosyltransferase family 4 protein [Mesonia ostreae]